MTLPELEDRPVIQVRLAARSDMGRTRTQNQDAFLVADLRDSEDGDPPLRMGQGTPTQAGPSRADLTLGARGLLMLVADGMGGAAAGAVASALAAHTIHDTLVSRWREDRDLTPARFTARMAEAVETAHAILHERASDQPELDGMGTTATVVGALNKHLYLAQIGDSRAYIFRGGVAHQITRDQSVVQTLVESGQLTEEEAAASERRNVILQALGVGPDVQVDLTYHPLRKDDVLLVCSDGLSGVLTRDHLSWVLETYGEPADACDVLIDMANERGGPDNITALVARFDGPGLEAPGEGDDVGRKPFQAPGS